MSARRHWKKVLSWLSSAVLCEESWNQSESSGMLSAATDRTCRRPWLRQVASCWWRPSRLAGLCRRMMEWAT